MNTHLITFFTLLSLEASVCAAPGSNQVDRSDNLHFEGSPIYRPDLLDALPPVKYSEEERAAQQEKFLQSIERFRRTRARMNPLSLYWEVRKLFPTIPEFSGENPFRDPIRLFSGSGSSEPIRGHLFKDE